MKIAIAAFNIEKANQTKYYNSQQEGLGKALCKLGYDVTVYHFVAADESSMQREDTYPNCGCLRSLTIPCKQRGVHALPENSVWEADTRLLIAFSDKSFGFPRTYHYFRAKGIPVIPYLGVLKSHNPSALKRFISDILPGNVGIYRRISRNPITPVISKTDALTADLRRLHIANVHTIPVGLDEDLLHMVESDSYSRTLQKNALRNEFGYTSSDMLLLFIGRLTAEKQPLTMLQLFYDFFLSQKQQDKTLPSLIMVGQGELTTEVDAFIEEHAIIAPYIKRIPSFPNQDMWKLYSISDCYINLNQQEIFGMSILEALYYNCPVIAYHAPGPDSILKDTYGTLANTTEDLLLALSAQADHPQTQLDTHAYVRDHYLWETSAKEIATIANACIIR